MKKLLSLSLMACGLLSSLNAEQTALETIEVSASLGTSVEKKNLTDSVIVITKETLDETHVTNLAQALNQLGNIAFTQNGGLGTSTSFYLRGMDTKRTLVLIDGVRYNDPTGIGAAAQFEQIMLSNVEQIEIIKGSQSGIWGADASAGVINIVTSKAKQGLHASANLEYGAFDTKKSSLQTSYATDVFDIILGGSFLHTDGFSASEPKQSDASYGKRFDELGLEKDSYKNLSINAKLGLNITNNDRLELTLQTINSDIEFDGGAGSDSDIPNTELQNRFVTLAYKHNDAINDINFQLNRSIFNRETLLSYGTYNYEGSVDEMKLEDKISYLNNSFLRFGGSYQKFEHTDITPTTDASYSARSLFATNYNNLALLSLGNTILTESLRYDDYNNFENALTGKIGLKQFLYKDFYLSFNAGTGFNAPTLNELYGQFGANPDLKPEKTKTYDATLGNDIFWLSGFYNKVTDMIEYDMTTWAYIQASGTSTFKGIELGYKDFYLNTLSTEFLYTYLDSKNAENEVLARRPKHQIDARITYYASEAFDVSVNAQYVGERYDATNEQGAQTGRYTIANAIANIQINNHLSFYAKIDNITDKYYQTVDGYATAGRSSYVGLNAKY